VSFLHLPGCKLTLQYPRSQRFVCQRFGHQLPSIKNLCNTNATLTMTSAFRGLMRGRWNPRNRKAMMSNAFSTTRRGLNSGVPDREKRCEPPWPPGKLNVKSRPPLSLYFGIQYFLVCSTVGCCFFAFFRVFSGDF